MIKNICFLIDHPFDLVLFLGLKNILEKEFGKIYTIALVTSHRYFLKVEDTDKFLEEFDEVVKVSQPSFQKNIIKNMMVAREFIKTVRGIDKLHPDTQFLSANRSELTTQLLMKYAKNHVLRILQRNPIDKTSSNFSNTYKINLKLSAIRNLYEILLSLPLSTSYRNRDTKRIKYFHYKNENNKNDLFLVIRNVEPKFDEIHFPYYFNKTQANNSKKVYFFGSRFLGWDYLENDKAITTINSILRMIENKYPDNTEYIYKPHPLESNEYTYLDLNKFELQDEMNSAEINFLKFSNEILGVYSIGSTSCKTAFNFGIDSYVGYPLFDFEKSIVEAFDALFEGLPSSIFIKDIKDIAEPTKENEVTFDRKKINIVNLLTRINDE
tara:strand:- start:20 stop:1165 length:1146 start_codon:yes stop_codon:yes gene_type:complete